MHIQPLTSALHSASFGACVLRRLGEEEEREIVEPLRLALEHALANKAAPGEWELAQQPGQQQLDAADSSRETT